MENNEKFSLKGCRLDYIHLIVTGIFSMIIMFNQIYIGIVTFFVFVALVIDYFKRCKKEKHTMEKRLKNLAFNINNITKKSLINMPIPFCVTEFNGNIIWNNDKFEEMIDDTEKSIVGSNLKDLFENINLRKVLNENKILVDKYEYKNKTYKLIYKTIEDQDEIDLKENTEEAVFKIVIYWFDETEYSNLKTKYEAEKEVIAFIEIDGYDDVIKSTPEEKRPMLNLDIESLFSNLETKTNGFLQKISRDQYLLFVEKSQLIELENKRFQILEKFREIDQGNTLPVTISIGIGVDGENINETSEFASGAMDLVLGRGGDQVAIKNKKDISFYGGKSKGFEKKTKVKSRLIGHALKEMINRSETIYIMGHKHPDMDAIGAAVGIFDMCKAYGKHANIVLNEVEEAIEEFVKKLKEDSYYDNMFISSEKAIENCKTDTLVVVVDTHRPSFVECRDLLDISKKVVLIDHHRRGIDYINETVLLFHEIYVSSTAEMVTELIQYTDYDIKIKKLTAEGLLGGIYLDTKNFEFKTGVRTFEAASYLKRLGADTVNVKSFFKSYMGDFLVRANIIQATELIDKRICISYTDADIDNINIIVAQAADELLNIKDIEASFVLGQKDGEIFISARSLGGINVHVLMEQLGGGGHIDIAGAQLRNCTLEEGRQKVKDVIDEYLKEEQ